MLQFFASFLGQFFERFLKLATSSCQKKKDCFWKCESSSRVAFASLFGPFFASWFLTLVFVERGGQWEPSTACMMAVPRLAYAITHAGSALSSYRRRP